MRKFFKKILRYLDIIYFVFICLPASAFVYSLMIAIECKNILLNKQKIKNNSYENLPKQQGF